ncbi:MAG: hypothetical protein K9M49_09630 [Candidatus Marinimicrobia bacterium]|nr:hypothetical protein [Candidatus Neomarinimicrobiota bacterium]MCF7851442.1 hypothetical protein [Candidatus Neomarinimicrobiota bacterium]MCF7905393.1 hypothetical protein [Candidatus Neomarinimicrobiota bacterium]
MKKAMLVVFSLILVVSVSAQESGLGVGFSSEGLEGKYWKGANAVAFHWDLNSHIGADYLFHDYDMVTVTDNPTPVYYGAGVGLGSYKSINSDFEETTELDLNIRGVAGIAFYVSSMPIDIYLEITPSLGVLGGTGFGIGSALGFRYYF